MNQLTFTTTIDKDTGTPVNFDIEGTMTINGEVIPLGYSSADFERVFAELLYWTKQVKNVTVNYVTEEWTK